ncbi:hypothetical protein [Candidatus Entotheonella palauensis]|uniref:hypothetical protein n=1 Tax=Candidatus Entotheonella palauensis TaxID=93172 RepID=UPI000B7DC951|nr:hypothetical protein [Candidatus Entotheonella palauensis]
MIRYLVWLSVLLMLLQGCLHPGCLYPIRLPQGPFKGRVVDADTGKPIKGAVALGSWTKLVLVGAGGSYSTYYDAQEVASDADDNFTIPGLGPRVLSALDPMYILIFKAGYKDFGPGPWESLKVDMILREKIKWQGRRAIIPLKKLTLKERKKRLLPSPGPVPYDKIPLLTNEINKERISQGLSPF